MEWSPTFSYFELVIIFVALCSSIYFVYIISNLTILQATSRIFIGLFVVALFLLALSHGLKNIENILDPPEEDGTPHSMSVRRYVWSILHEFGFALNTLSLFMFSLERYITAKFCIVPTLKNQIIAVGVGVLISVLAMAYSELVHLVESPIIPVTCMNIVDIAALLTLIFSSKFSIKHYRNTTGKLSLETRFQISDVYIWTKAVIPVACLAFLLKFTFVVVIWMLWTVENSISYQIDFTRYYQTVMDVFIIVLPFLLSSNHRRLKRLRLRIRSRVTPEAHVRTLDGKAIHMKETFHDHFDFLRNHWK